MAMTNPPPPYLTRGNTMTTPAPATLHRGRHGYSWRVTCPYCGKTHHHGGGPLDQDPHALLGHRLAHCGSGDGYVLVAMQRNEAHQ